MNKNKYFRTSLRIVAFFTCIFPAIWSHSAHGQVPGEVMFEHSNSNPPYVAEPCLSLDTCELAAVKMKASLPPTDGFSCEEFPIVIDDSYGPVLINDVPPKYQYHVAVHCDRPNSIRRQIVNFDLAEPCEVGGEFPCDFYLAAPAENDLVCNESNPCNPADGNKFETQVDYATPAQGGLSFTRYYNSLGAHNTDDRIGAGWRHTYSRSLDEVPDQQPHSRFDVPVNESSIYGNPEDACEIGWNEIKALVWSGEHAAATASYAGGNICKISTVSGVVAYFPVRSRFGWPDYVPPASIRTVTRPNGQTHHFEVSGSDWINLLDATVKLEEVPPLSDTWVFTDRNDVKETYNSLGQLVKIEQRNGQIEYLYYALTVAQGGDDDSETLDKVVGPFGHEITFNYSLSGHLEAVVTPDGTIQYDHNGSNNLLSVTYQDATDRQYVYDHPSLRNHLTGIIDENGDRYITWDYDDAGRATLSELAASKEKVELAYNGNGTTTLTMGNGATRTYEFETQQGRRRLKSLSGDVCGTCDVGDVSSRSYDNGYLYDATNWKGFITRTERNPRGLTETLTEAMGTAEERITGTVWHGTFRLPTKVTTAINVTDYVYLDGNLDTLTITGGGKTRVWDYEYTASGQIDTIDGPRTDVTDVTDYDYHECTTGAYCGQLKKITDALGNITDFGELDPVNAYDDSGRLKKMTDPNGLVTEFAYDVWGRLNTVTQTLPGEPPRVTSMIPDDFGQLKTMTLPDGVMLAYDYDAAHYLKSVLDTAGNKIEYAYDAMGNLSDVDTYDEFNDLQRELGYLYDVNNRLDKITRASFPGNDIDVSFDLVGNLDNVTDPNFHFTDHTYDGLNRLKQTIDATLSGFTSYGYDEHDNLTSVTDPNGAVTTYIYDGLDNLDLEISPDRGTTDYEPDDAGNVTKVTDARGVVVDREYDALNRLTDIKYPASPSLDVKFHYDGTSGNSLGRMYQMDDETGSTTFSYTGFGELDVETRSINDIGVNPEVFVVDYNYNLAGSIEKITLPDGRTVDYLFDTLGRVKKIKTTFNTIESTLVKEITYKPFGSMASWKYGNDLVQTMEYDQQYMPDRITVGNAIGNLFDLDYSLDAGGVNIETIADGIAGGTDWNQTLHYDALDRLDDEVGSYGTQDYYYDANGNRTFIQDESQAVLQELDYTPNSNRMSDWDQNPVDIDAAGNTIDEANDNRDFVYDDRSRIVSASKDAVVKGTYRYDGFGQLTYKVQKPNTPQEFKRVFLYGQEGKLIFESIFNGSGTRTDKVYVWLNGAPVAYIKTRYFSGGGLWDEVLTYIHPDHLGTPRIGTTDEISSPVISWRWHSDAFGVGNDESDPDGDGKNVVFRLRFPGQHNDGSMANFYNYYRTYDPSTGRYLESDPIGLWGGTNTYEYVYGNPLIYIDPYGLWALGDPLPQGLVDGVTGFGDGLSGGITSWIRDQAGIDGGVNKCSSLYSGSRATGNFATLTLGGGRLLYAGLAKGYSVAASTGRAASAGRSQLRRLFGGGDSLRPPNLLKYTNDAALRAGAGRTNRYFNAVGAATVGLAANDLANGDECECSQ